MSWLFLDSVFAQFFKLAQRQGHPAPVVVSTNYLTLGLGVLIYLLVTRQLILPFPVVLTGVACGASFVVAMLTMNHALAKAPVGLVLTAFRMAIVFPVALGTWIWNEGLLRNCICKVSISSDRSFLRRSKTGGRGRLGNEREIAGLERTDNRSPACTLYEPVRPGFFLSRPKSDFGAEAARKLDFQGGRIREGFSRQRVHRGFVEHSP